MRIDLVSGHVCLVFKNPFLGRSLRSHWVLDFAGDAVGTFHTVPPPARDRVEADAVVVIASVAEIAEEHLFLVPVILAFGADLAISALPVVLGNMFEHIEAEANAAWVH